MTWKYKNNKGDNIFSIFFLSFSVALALVLVVCLLDDELANADTADVTCNVY